MPHAAAGARLQNSVVKRGCTLVLAFFVARYCSNESAKRVETAEDVWASAAGEASAARTSAIAVCDTIGANSEISTPCASACSSSSASSAPWGEGGAIASADLRGWTR